MCSAEMMDAEMQEAKDAEEKRSQWNHDVKELHVDLDALTAGDINWDNVVSSLEWMVDKVKASMRDHETKTISSFLAKTVVMHVIHCFHHCRNDDAPGFARAEAPSLNQPPSAKESHKKSASVVRSSPPPPST